MPVEQEMTPNQIIMEEDLSNTEQKLIIPIEEEVKEDSDQSSSKFPVFDLKKQQEFTNTNKFPDFPGDEKKKIPFELKLDQLEKENDFTEIDVKSKKNSFIADLLKINFFKTKEVDEEVQESKAEIVPIPSDSSYLSPRSKKI